MIQFARSFRHGKWCGSSTTKISGFVFILGRQHAFQFIESDLRIQSFEQHRNNIICSGRLGVACPHDCLCRFNGITLQFAWNPKS